MKIVFLDVKTIGEDIDLSGFERLGEVVKYGFSSPEEARVRTRDADVIILNNGEYTAHTSNDTCLLTVVDITAAVELAVNG